MELKDFVKQALTEIISAVREAATEGGTDQDGAVISPRIDTGPADGATFQIAREDGHGIAFPVEFDLSVTVTEGAELIEPAWVHLDKFANFAGNRALRIAAQFKMAQAGSIRQEWARNSVSHLCSVPGQMLQVQRLTDG